MQNKLVLFDIDHTIFNAALYRDNLYKNLATALKYDLNHFYEVGEKAYKKIRKTKHYLSPNQLLETILPPHKTSADLEKSRQIFWEEKLYESSVYPDVKQTFKYLADKGIQIGIFSTGDLAQQTMKIQSLKEYLDENHIHIAPDKFKIIKGTLDVYKNYHIYLIDDYPQILEGAKAHNKNVFTILIKRKESASARGLIIPDNFRPDATITNLNQLTDIIRA